MLAEVAGVAAVPEVAEVTGMTIAASAEGADSPAGYYAYRHVNSTGMPGSGLRPQRTSQVAGIKVSRRRPESLPRPPLTLTHNRACPLE